MTSAILAQLADQSAKKQREILSYHIRDALAELLLLDSADDISEQDSFHDLGTDSAQAVEFKYLLEEILGQAVKSTVIIEYPSVCELVGHLFDKYVSPLYPTEPETDQDEETSQSNDPLDSSHAIIEPSKQTEANIAVSIVAEACCFPGATNSQTFWQQVKTGALPSIEPVDPDTPYGYGKLPRKPLAHSVLNQLNLSDAEAEFINNDSMLATTLPVFAAALSEYEISLPWLQSSSVGVFAAAPSTFNKSEHAYCIPLANSLSYLLNLKGPSETINTFCSSAYVALHHAKQSILNGECEAAIVVGVNLIDEQDFLQNAVQGTYNELLDSNNKVKSFSNDASGFVRSEGVGVVVLTSVSAVKQNNYQELARILGTAAGHGGKSYSIEAPNAKAMAKVIKDSLANAQINTASIDYIEAHGIGNKLADALELQTLTDSYAAHCENTEKYWRIGTVKPTLGHPEVAAGMASLIKTLYALRHRTLPGIAGFTNLNSELDDAHRLQLHHDACPWPKENTDTRIAGLHSYGIGGVTAHIILCEGSPNTLNHSVKRLTPEINTQNEAGDESQLELNIPEPWLTKVNEISKKVFKHTFSQLNLAHSPIDQGFDSIAVVNFCRQINAQLGINLKLGQLLSLENFAQLAALITRQLNNKKPQKTEVISEKPDFKSRLNTPFPLSEIQKGLWLIQKTKPESTGFNVPMFFKAQSNLDTSVLNQTLQHLLIRHPALGVNFQQSDANESLIQFYAHKDINSLTVKCIKVATEEDVWPICQKLLRTPFNLANDTLLRCYYLTAEGSDSSYVFFNVHHIVFDGFSGVQFINEFWHTYAQLTANNNHNECDVALINQEKEFQFLEYIDWEKSYLKSEQAEEDRLWWKNTLSELSLDINLPYDKKPHSQLAHQGVGCQTLKLDSSATMLIKQFALQYKVNPSVVILTALSVLLRIITQKDQIAVTSPVFGRPAPEFSSGVGCFINLIVTQFKVGSQQTLNELLHSVKNAYIDAIDHSEFPFSQVSAELGFNMLMLKSNQSVLPISYSYQNIFDEMPHTMLSQLGINADFSLYQESDDHYTLEVYDFRSHLELKIKYKQDLFYDETIQRHLDYLERILNTLLTQSELPIGAINYLSKTEQAFLLNQSGPQLAPSNEFLSVYSLFEKQAGKTPDAIALVDHLHQLTYQQLESFSCVWSQHLLQQGLAPGQIVALVMPRSVDAIVAILAILRSGCAYLPIDPEIGQQRLTHILKQSGATMAVINPSIQERLSPVLTEIECCEININMPLTHSQIETSAHKAYDNHAQNLAYVIYTSGSTGQPKGVMIAHGALTNLATHMVKEYTLNTADRVLQFAPLQFDMSVEEIFPALICGAGVVIRQEDDIQPQAFFELVTQNQVSVLNIPPVFYDVITMLRPSQKQQLFNQLSVVAFGGEALPEAVLNDISSYDVRVFNAYGPTEYTVNASIAELTQQQTLNIGRPISNTQFYILDQQLQPVPVGIAGELHISGQGLALGYLNQASLTEEKFIANPFTGGKMYKTGDRVRWLGNGQVEYIGRIDQQMKIRGFRVEPGEIENTLCASPFINSAVVIFQQKSQDNTAAHQLIAYYTATPDCDIAQIKQTMASQLPSYMIPSVFQQVDEMPLTPNGKVNRKALANIELTDMQVSITEPATDYEKQVYAIWQDVLAQEKMGIDHDFFSLGGHSLLAIQIILRVNKTFNIDTPLSVFFDMPTIREFSLYIEKLEPSPANLSDAYKSNSCNLNAFYENGKVHSL